MTFVDLHNRQRAIAMNLVTRIEEIASDTISTEGERSQAVIDEAIVPLAGIDGAPVPGGLVKLLRLSDGENQLGYPVKQLGQSIDASGNLTPHETDASIEGIALLDGKAVPVVDGFSLFARFGTCTQHRRKLTCSLPENDDWAQRMLAPLITAAGYTVSTNTAHGADIAIVTDGASGAPHNPSGKVLQVHSDINKAGDPNNGIYRYDRTGLLEALHQAQLEIVS